MVEDKTFWKNLAISLVTPPEGKNRLGFLGLMYFEPVNNSQPHFLYTHAGHGEERDRTVIYIAQTFYKYLENVLTKQTFEHFLTAILIYRLVRLMGYSDENLCLDLMRGFLRGHKYSGRVIEGIIHDITNPVWMDNNRDLSEVYVATGHRKTHLYKDIAAYAEDKSITPEEVLLGETNIGQSSFKTAEEIMETRGRAPPRVMGLGGGTLP